MIQEVIDTTTKEGLRFPFKDKDWVNKFGIYCLISIIPSLTIIPFIFLLFIPILGLVSLFSFVFIIPIILVLQIYLNGYVLQIIRNVKEDSKNTIPLHTDIMEKMRMGLIKLAIELGPILFALLMLLIAIGFILIGSFALGESPIFAIILITMGTIGSLISTLILMIIVAMVTPSMIYIYLETGSIGKAYCFKNIRTVIQEAWQPFAILYIMALIGGMILSGLGQFPCIGFIAMALGIAYITFVIAFVTGKIYSKLKTKII